jgi:hypothetical protein
MYHIGSLLMTQDELMCGCAERHPSTDRMLTCAHCGEAQHKSCSIVATIDWLLRTDKSEREKAFRPTNNDRVIELVLHCRHCFQGVE